MLKKNIAIVLILFSLVTSSLAFGADEASSSGVLDDSIKDFSIVLGSGAAGAILGLSTLSFVDTPSKHFKNVFVGGAIGIVIGVGVVIFSQASRSAAVVGQSSPINNDTFESLSKKEFSEYKIVENDKLQPTLGWNFTF